MDKEADIRVERVVYICVCLYVYDWVLLCMCVRARARVCVYTDKWKRDRTIDKEIDS